MYKDKKIFILGMARSGYEVAKLLSPDNKILIPASLSLGASFLLLIDNISRVVISIEIPIGILTSIIGVPLFLYLLRRGYSEWS